LRLGRGHAAESKDIKNSRLLTQQDQPHAEPLTALFTPTVNPQGYLIGLDLMEASTGLRRYRRGSEPRRYGARILPARVFLCGQAAMLVEFNWVDHHHRLHLHAVRVRDFAISGGQSIRRRHARQKQDRS